MAAGDNKSFSRVSDVDMEVDSDDTPLSAPVFEIEVKATFIIMEKTRGVADGTFVEAGRFISHVLHEFSLEYFINDGYCAVLDMLNSMRVPVHPSEVEEISGAAVRLATAARDKDEVVRMQVVVDAVVDEVPFGNHDDTNDHDDDNDDEGPVTEEEMAEKVKTNVVEGSGKDCPICLEEMVAGSEAACMPCSHAFHDLCIKTWLTKKKRCPCCRFKLSMD